ESGHLKFIEIEKEGEWLPGIRVHVVNGHTEGMMLPEIEYAPGKKLLYMADLIASSAHLKIPYVMGYDTRPLDTMKEKEEHLQRALRENTILFFEHDPVIECVTLKQDERGTILKDASFALNEAGI